MDYFRTFISSSTVETHPTGAETIEKLCDRVQSSTLLEDRRDAVRAIKSLSRKFRLDVGTKGMEILLEVLEKDRTDAEICNFALDALTNIMSDEMTEEIEPNQLVNIPPDLGSMFTEMLLKKTENVQLILSLVDDFEFHVRWPAIKLLTIMLRNRLKEMQECILMSPMGISKLMDLLSDSREVIRNDGLLLLLELNQGNTNIQKIVAFENAFERILAIIDEEGRSDGGVIVEDCLRLLLILLKNNAPNQTLFKEGSFVQKLTSFFELSSDDTDSQRGWSAQKVVNFQLMLQVLRQLVSPINKAQGVRTCQALMHTCGLLKALCSILMASGVPADVLTETINTVAEVIRGCPTNQDYFSGVSAPSDPPQPAIVVLLMSMVNERQPFALRCAVLYCFQSFLYQNKNGQAQIVQTLLPKTSEENQVTTGQMLCVGLFSHDPLSAWFASTALLHSVLSNTLMKEELLRVHLATTLGAKPVTLLQHCCNILAQELKSELKGARFQTKVGILMMLCNWLAHCPVSVRKFLGEPEEQRGANVGYLISEVSAADNDESEAIVRGLCAFALGVCVYSNPDDVSGLDTAALIHMIEKRVGVEAFVERLSQLGKVEAYTRAMKQPQPSYKQPSDVVFDYEFTRLFKSLEHEIVKAIQPVEETPEQRKKKLAQFAEHENVVLQYKEIIKQQDEELTHLRAETGRLSSTVDEQLKEVTTLREELQSVKDQNALLKVPSVRLPFSSDQNQQQQRISGTASLPSLNQEMLESRDTKLSEMQAVITTKDSEIKQLKDQLLLASSSSNSNSNEVDTLRSQLSESQERCKQSEASIIALRTENSRLSACEQELHRLQSSSADAISAEVTELKAKLEETNDKLSKTLAEHEDLLVLLADQDEKILSMKSRLKEHGIEMEKDDDDEDEDFELSDEEEENNG